MDRLSELHDSLIHHIFSFLPTEDVVRTTVLSKRWVDLWTTVPYFTFIAKSVHLDIGNYRKFKDFVYQTMKHWKGTKIHKFSVYLMYCSHSFHRDRAVWVDIAEQHKVEKLHLVHRSDPDLHHSLEIGCCLPSCMLFSSPYTGIGVDMPGTVCIGTIQWDQLKSLTIDSLDVDQSVIDNVLFGSPELETLELLCCPRNVNIHSTSLKKLYLCYDEKNYYPDSKYPDSALHIWTPNLQVLRIEGIVRTQFSSLFVPSLIEAILTFQHATTCLSQPQGDDMLKVIFQSIGHVHKLVVGHWIIKVLQVMEKTALPSPLLNLKRLTIDSFDRSRSLAGIVNLLKISPNIAMLTIRNDIGDDNEKQLEDKWSCRKRSRIPEDEWSCRKRSSIPEDDELLNTFLMNLRILELDVELYAYKPVFSIAKFVLKNANALERIVVRRKDSLVGEMQQLLRMSGYTTNTEVVFTLRPSLT